MDEGYNYSIHVANGTQFVQGVAAGPIIMKDGFLLATKVDSESVHPRTVIGVAEDGKIIMGVIDGRQPGYSNGATYASSAIWMRSLGARTVMNLDGGGSSNIVLRDPNTEHYETCNSPSDGDLRKVYNSVLVSLRLGE